MYLVDIRLCFPLPSVCTSHWEAGQGTWCVPGAPKTGIRFSVPSLVRDVSSIMKIQKQKEEDLLCQRGCTEGYTFFSHIPESDHRE